MSSNPYHVRLAISRYGTDYRAELFTEDLGDTGLDPPRAWDALAEWMDYLRLGAVGMPADSARRAGRALHQFLFGGTENAAKWADILSHTRRHGRPVRLLIDLTTDGLPDLPFGLLCDPLDNYFLFRPFPDHPGIRFVRIHRRCTPRLLRLGKPIRLLLAASEPPAVRAFGCADRVRNLARGLRGLLDVAVCSPEGPVPLESVLAGLGDEWAPEQRQAFEARFCRTTLGQLRAALQQGGYEVLHLLAHGSGQGPLLCGAGGNAERVAPGELAGWRPPPRKPGLEMAFLQVCRAGRDPGLGSFGTLAEQLINPRVGNLAAVLASPYPLDAEHSTAAAVAFYRNLAAGRDPDAALERGGGEDDWTWAFLELWVRPGTLPGTTTPGAFQFPRPYRGLERFEERDADVFFGREAAVQDLFRCLQREPVLAVVGDSGSGKSSLLQAGLVPRVRAHKLAGLDNWQVVSCQPGAQPARSLAAALTRGEPGPAAAPADGRLHLGDLLRQRIRPEEPLLLLLDQFEELFTLCDDVAERAAVAEALAEAVAEHPGHFRLVLAVRSDYLSAAANLPGRVQLARRAWVPRTPGPEDLRRIIAGPARRYGYRFQGALKRGDPRHRRGLLDRILADPLLAPAAAPGARPAGAAAAPPLPLLEFALERLWLHAVGQGGQQFTHAAFDEIRGLAGAIAQHAEDVYARLPSAFPGVARIQKLAEYVFTRLVTSQGTRRPRPRHDLEVSTGRPDDARRLIDYLVGERLLTIRGAPDDLGRTQVEIAHEVLIEGWPALRKWLTGDPESRAVQESFERDADRWVQGAPGLPPRSRDLLPGPQLARRYLRWLTEARPKLTGLQREFREALRVFPVSRVVGVGGELLDFTLLREAGWAVLFAPQTHDAIRRAVEPLIAHRRRQVPADRFRVIDGQVGDTVRALLQRHGAVPGHVMPTRLPYYLLLVGGPREIPFVMQSLLDVDYAVGRLAFDHPEDYEQYARSVVAYETEYRAPNARAVAFWGLADQFLGPLAHGTPGEAGHPEEPPITHVLGYGSVDLTGPHAAQTALAGVLEGETTSGLIPALLVAASPGIGAGSLPAIGALLSREWSGNRPVHPHQFFAAADVSDRARPHGLVAILLAHYAGGLPVELLDQPPAAPRGRPQHIPCGIPDLAQRLLAHPSGGALAVLANVGPAVEFWTGEPGKPHPVGIFRNLVGRLLSGEPVGSATGDLSARYAALSSDLLEELERSPPEEWSKNAEVQRRRDERQSAGEFLVLGDPAVQIRVDRLA
jgi:hypothetical protein